MSFSEEFQKHPVTFKLGVFFLCAGWLIHYLFLYKLFINDDPMKQLYRQLIIGGLICFFVIKTYNWARMLCVFFNFGVIGVYLLFCTQFYLSEKWEIFSIGLVVIVAFVLSTIFLMHKNTAAVFKKDTATKIDNG